MSKWHGIDYDRKCRFSIRRNQLIAISKTKPAECTRSECPILRNYGCIGKNCDYYGKQKKPPGCTYEEVCPGLRDGYECLGKFCPVHEDYIPLNHSERFRAFVDIRYGGNIDG